MTSSDFEDVTNQHIGRNPNMRGEEAVGNETEHDCSLILAKGKETSSQLAKLTEVEKTFP